MPTNDGSAKALIRRRHVLYVEGYDPQGAEGYHNLFSRSFKRFLKIWPLKTSVGELQIDSDDLAPGGNAEHEVGVLPVVDTWIEAADLFEGLTTEQDGSQLRIVPVEP